MKARRRASLLVAAVAFAVLMFLAVGFTAFTKRAFICENTGSRMGYTEWFFGARTGKWSSKSSIESYVEEHFPDRLRHSWTSYAGTGYNIYGMKVMFGHGRPGPIRGVPTELLNSWFESLSDADKKAFYDLLVANNRDAIRARTEEIWKWDEERERQ